GKHEMIVFLDKRSKQKISQFTSKQEFLRLQSKLNAYFVEVDGVILTVGHHYRHFYQ
ncbi:MAG: hypothetical protein HQL49_13905, partial [Gammaproteobacteria bacterium]|nr:hypothetical protein [Gammaproteobacteria bacterium]